MSFIEFFATYTEYTNLSSMWGLLRVLLWTITILLTKIAYALETIYKHIFSLFSIIYSEPVVNFLQGWIAYLWIPIAISILILAYNLILGDSAEGNSKLKTFVRNLCLLAIVLFGLPYLFLGHGSNSNRAGVFVSSQDAETPYYSVNGDEDYGIVDLFLDDNGEGLIKGVSSLSGNPDKTYTYSVVANNVYDLTYIFGTQLNMWEYYPITSRWTQYLEDGKMPKNKYQIETHPGGQTATVFNGASNDDIMSIDIGKNLSYDEWLNTTYERGGTPLKDFIVPGYDKVSSQTQEAIQRYDEFLQNQQNGSGESTATTSSSGNSYYDRASVYANTQFRRNIQDEALALQFQYSIANAKYYFFNHVHNIDGRNYIDGDIDKGVESVDYNNLGSTQYLFSIWNPFGDDIEFEIPFFSSRPFVYHVEWGVMFVQLIALMLVMLLTSYKVAKIIYEIIFNHFLAIFYGAADLSNGQRIKEVLQSIVNLLLSLLFAVVSVELYFIITDSVNTVTFISGNYEVNRWMIALVDFFMAIAVIKGPSVLEKILGIEGGLSGAFRDMDIASRTIGRAGKTVSKVGKGTLKLAHGAAGAASGAAKGVARRGYYSYNKHKGKNAARAAGENGNQTQIGSSRDTSRNERAGNEGQFTAVKNKKNDRNQKPENDNFGANGTRAANSEMARQGRDIGAEMGLEQVDRANKHGITKESERAESDAIVANEMANRHRGNIQNAALAEQAKARSEGVSIDDAEALTRAYRSSGFTEEEAKSLAARDVSGGSYSEKKEKFENSISAKAQQDLHDSPLSYGSQMAAYKESAVDHYRALGFDEATANNMATDTANRVLVEDNQGAIRNRAKELQRTALSEMSDDDALTQASNEILGSSSVGYSGSIDEAVRHITSQGTLREGMVQGRIANNAIRESAESNSRAGSLMRDEGPSLVESKAALWGGFKTKRNIKSLGTTGYERGATVEERRREKRTDKQYEKLQKERRKNNNE